MLLMDGQGLLDIAQLKRVISGTQIADIYSMPFTLDTVPRAVQKSSQFILTAALWGKHYDYPHFLCEEMKAQGHTANKWWSWTPNLHFY